MSLSQLTPPLPPPTATSWMRRAMDLRKLNRVEESLGAYSAALALEPENPEIRCRRAFALLSAGQYREGFAEHEWRWEAARVTRPEQTDSAILGKQWTGSDIAGKRILLHAEQGLGDSIQFLRYLKLVEEREADIVLEVQPALRGLAKWITPKCLVGNGIPLGTFDFHCSLLSLPAIFKTDLCNIPAPVCFTIPHAVQKRWASQIPGGGGIKVGLVWAGNPENSIDKRRSIPVNELTPFLELPKANHRLYSFQIGSAAQQLGQWDKDGIVHDLFPDLTSLTETAAALCRMDWLITVDSALAHLAASLGIKVALMLPFHACWRWMTDRSDSPWYPQMQLFRQERPNAWTSVVNSVCASRYALFP